MYLITILVFLGSVAFANPVERADESRVQDEALIPGTKVPIEEMNTAPTEPELQEEDSEFRGTLEARKKKEQELLKESKTKMNKFKGGAP
jgi:hypothetical protein